MNEDTAWTIIIVGVALIIACALLGWHALDVVNANFAFARQTVDTESLHQYTIHAPHGWHCTLDSFDKVIWKVVCKP